MSARPIVVPGSVQRETKQAPMQNSPEQDIANLTYALWQERGCPEGSPEQDWIRAEELIQTGRGK